MAMQQTGIQSLGASALQQLAMLQARRTAERAEAEAQRLRVEAAELMQRARRTQEEARRLYRQSDQQENAAEAARSSLALGRGRMAAQAEIERQGMQILERIEARTAVEQAAPVRNIDGQVTGRLINTTA
ncbi:MAG: hypothetical protein N2441_02290 [Rhodocyclaceae bacterium]|nr:hypothetical protein [Rhodocyclaceae bacterium]